MEMKSSYRKNISVMRLDGTKKNHAGKQSCAKMRDARAKRMFKMIKYMMISLGDFSTAKKFDGYMRDLKKAYALVDYTGE
jgi:hypothetical protein